MSNSGCVFFSPQISVCGFVPPQSRDMMWAGVAQEPWWMKDPLRTPEVLDSSLTESSSGHRHSGSPILGDRQNLPPWCPGRDSAHRVRPSAGAPRHLQVSAPWAVPALSTALPSYLLAAWPPGCPLFSPHQGVLWEDRRGSCLLTSSSFRRAAAALAGGEVVDRPSSPETEAAHVRA